MIIIPMAGNSSRFFNAGYQVPKYQLPLWGVPMFDWVLKTFEDYFQSEEFRFVVRKDLNVKDFVEERCILLGITDFSITELERETKGQAETVYLSLTKEDMDKSLCIFNADSFDLNFKMPDLNQIPGLLDVFLGEGDHWSFVKPAKSEKTILNTGNIGKVESTTEKNRISNLCSDGMYFFQNVKLFVDAYISGQEQVKQENKEIYIAPLYNQLIKKGISVYYRMVKSSTLYFCGTPDEYNYLLQIKTPSINYKK